MMTNTELILLAVALAMDCTTVSIVVGMQYGRLLSLRVLLRMALLFGLFQALMPFAGWAAIIGFSARLETFGHLIAFCLLAFIGGKMVRDAIGHAEVRAIDPQRWRIMVLLAVATSIDALAVGVSMGVTGYDSVHSLTCPLSIIGAMSFLLSVVGYGLGCTLHRCTYGWLKPELAGGLILIGLGIKILVAG